MRTLFSGASARAEEQLRDHYSIELIDQKIREADANLRAAKLGLASLIQRERSEERQVEAITGRITELTVRAKAAIAAGRDDMAAQAAQAIADMENELTRRRETVARLEARILQLRQSVETANRRIIDLKQGAVSARAVRREQSIQKRLSRHLGGASAMDEADMLIARVLGQDDPFEQGEILNQIDRELDHRGIGERMSDAGFGPKGRSTAADVLDRLKGK
ncbi:PspA/IM30 family protein [Sulfitobacter sp. MF3-043]|uniref:PspA/IM30 family protein n=1 Tax=Sulfitobacter sediminivivens TaxID=3252902 RepID=UPI0036DCADA3